MSVAIVGFGAISALGRGAAAVRVAAAHEVTCVARDEELAAAGLKKPFCARAAVNADGDRATALLSEVLADCIQSIGVLPPRVGLAIGTSSGGMRAFTAERGSALDRTYAGPVAAAAAELARTQGETTFAPAAFVLAACASSAIAIGLGRTWLEDDRCDLVLAGGFDAVSVFVAAGFECLRATCGERGPRPFRRDRDGLALGEGAAMLALARPDAKDGRVLAWVTGFGASCDAHHLTAPSPDGAGLARAARRALADAGAARVDLISAHGTATAQNDGAEAKAIASLALGAPAFSFKGTVGHTLGAAGALETLAAIDAMTRGLAPATAGDAAEVEPGVDIRTTAAPHPSRIALKLASAFGGANAALVLERAEARTRDAVATVPGHAEGRGDRFDVAVSRAVRSQEAMLIPAKLAEYTGYALDRIVRADALVQQSLAAVAALREQEGDLRGAGIVLGLGLATVETNAKFQARIARAEPRRFPYTTPNAAAGECAVAFGLDGPAFAVGGGPHGGLEAIAVAADLVRAGQATRIVVVAADEAGPASESLAPGTRSGAVALLVTRAGHAPRHARLTAWSVGYAPRAGAPSALPPMDAHRALLPLVEGRPARLHALIPWGGEAAVALAWP